MDVHRDPGKKTSCELQQFDVGETDCNKL